ncbi:MAG: CxxC-x17-CxxC domain-containing protein [Candidatus Nanoarchaeia archaeon]
MKNDYSTGEREMHDAVCSKCKKATQVPFKPHPDKDVFCQECFRSKPRTGKEHY